MKSGKTLWNKLCYHYDRGLQQVRQFQKIWDMEKSYVDLDRFTVSRANSRTKVVYAQVWKDACLLYFQAVQPKPILNDIERPVNDLEDLINNVSNRIKNKLR